MNPSFKEYTVKDKIHFTDGQNSKKELHKGKAIKKSIQTGRTPRISRLMALAIKFNLMVKNGEIKDYADIAKLGHVTRARLSQLMNLTLLAPEIQEEILFFPEVSTGRDKITEHHLRPICAELNWSKQRKLWFDLKYD
jgi:hypothetical protein